MKKIISEVTVERFNQDQEWGEQNHPPYEWLVILMEEVGEASKAALEALSEEDWLLYRKELIHVAATAVAAIESLDRDREVKNE